MLTKNEVRLSIGVPAPELFVSAIGTPIVIDILTGYAYFLSTTGEVTSIVSPLQLLGVGGLVADAYGVQKVSLPKSLFSGLFTFDIPQSKWFMYHNGTQVYASTAITSVDGAGKIATNHAGGVDTALLQSRLCPRYQANRGQLFSLSVIAPNPTYDGVREWGLGAPSNGVAFRLKPDGNLYAVLWAGGVQTYEGLIDTNGLTDFDVSKGNLYDIQFQWRGIGDYKFYINQTLVHTIQLLGTLTALSIENPALPVWLQSKYTTQDVNFIVGCVDITSENGAPESLVYGAAYAEGVSVVTDTPVIIIKQPLTIGGDMNTRDLVLSRISLNCSKKGVFKVWLTRDVTAFTGPTFKTINSGSFVESDSTSMNPTAVRATAVDLTKCHFITAVPVEALVPREVVNPLPHEILFPIVRGDYLVVTCTAATANADAVVEWGEYI